MAIGNDRLIRQLNDLEIHCVIGSFENFNFSSALECLKSHCPSELFSLLERIAYHITHHEYSKILEISKGGIDLRRDGNTVSIPEEDSEDKFISYSKQLVLLFTGVAALQEFVKANMCGPYTEDNSDLPIAFSEYLRDMKNPERVHSFLSKEYEFPVSNIKQPHLLCMSLMFLGAKIPEGYTSLTHKWWHMRCLMMQQQILPEKIASLHDEMVRQFCATVSMEWINEEKNSEALLLLFMEAARMHLCYHENIRAKQFISSARNLVGLCYELSGAYGKRTHFQQKPVAQLFVKLSRDSEKLKENFVVPETSDYPPNLHLQDDTLLDNIAFMDMEENRVDHLRPEEQIVLLGECCLWKKCGSSDNLFQEETITYVNCLLAQPKVWSIYVTALIMRCKSEKNSSRRMDRALRQLETVISCIKKEIPPFHVRMPMLYAVPFPMLWSLEKELADLLMSIGAIKSALDIYKGLNLWEEIVYCYHQLGRNECAVEVIQNRLKIEKTPLLYCLLGDVTDDPKMYLKADNLSKGTNARCQRSLGYFYYKRKDYKTCIPHFTRAVEINHLQPEVWFSLGYAASQCEDFQLAARAYRQVVQLDGDHFEAWNNLSTAYIKTRQKERAWRSLQEALKCNYENWHVWENFLLVSTDIGAFEDAIRAYHRLIDIREKHVDVEILEILVKAINQNLSDFGGQPAFRLKTAVLQLFGRLTALVLRDGKVWELYSLLLWPDETADGDINILEKAVHYQQQATVCLTQGGSWAADFPTFLSVLKTCDRNARLFENLIGRLENQRTKREKRTLFNIMMKGILTKASQNLAQYEGLGLTELSNLMTSIKSTHIRIQEL